MDETPLSVPPARPAAWPEASASLHSPGLALFSASLPLLLESWIQRRSSIHTQRAYRQDLHNFLHWCGIHWPEEAARLVSVTVPMVQRYRSSMSEQGQAPGTINRRLSSLSNFYGYLAACAMELRLPVLIPNPAYSGFVARLGSQPLHPTRALSLEAARRLLELPAGDSLPAVRDRAILKTFLYTGARLGTVCGLMVDDFVFDGVEATLRVCEKRDQRRTLGLHRTAAEAIAGYLARAEVREGPLFRPRQGPGGERLAGRAFSPVALYHLVRGYLDQLPAAESSGRARHCYTPHSLRATTATLLLEAGVELTEVQLLLGHRHVATTQVYDKRRRLTLHSASHRVPL